MNPIIRKYNISGPRYTSYPTVPYWDDESFSAELWQQSFLKSFEESNDKSGISLYIHLPFLKAFVLFAPVIKELPNSILLNSLTLKQF